MDERESIKQALSDAYVQQYAAYRSRYSIALALCYTAVIALILLIVRYS